MSITPRMLLVMVVLCSLAGWAFTAQRRVPAVNVPAPWAPTYVVNVTDPPYNAVCDGIVDDTAALQAVFDAYQGVASVAIQFPSGRCRITSGLTYANMSPNYSLRLSGVIGGTPGLTGSHIYYDGAIGGTVLYLAGVVGLLMEHLEIHGGFKARIGLQIDATNAEAIPTSTGSDPGTVRKVTIGGLAGTDPIGIALGHPTGALTDQVGDLTFQEVWVTHDFSDVTGAGIRTLQGGNVKNFWVQNSFIRGFAYGIDWLLASGVFTAKNMFTANGVAEIRTGGAAMTIQGWETETPSARFLVGSAGGNPAQVAIIGSSYEGNPPSDDIIIDYSGSLTLIGNTFYNQRVPGTTYPIIRLTGAPHVDDPISGATTFVNLVSLGNWYQRAPNQRIPVIDGAGALLSNDPTSTHHLKDIAVTSLGDNGGEGGAMLHLVQQLPDSVTRPRTITFAQLTPVDGGFTVPNGALFYCSNCTIANPCASGGTGAFAKRIAGVWICN